MPTKASRTDSQGNDSRDQSPRDAAASTAQDFGPASTRMVMSLVSERIVTSSPSRMWACSQSMS